MDIRTKRIYEPLDSDEGYRVLVDRIWPKGMSKEKARIDSWLKELAPSKELRQWFGHEPSKWEEFRERYFEEPTEHRDQLNQLAEMTQSGPLTIVYSSRETRYNNAVALKAYLESKAG